MRLQLRRALIELIDNHDEALAEHFADGKLALESYKEYIELFARSLKETMESRKASPICSARSVSKSRRRRSICSPSCAGRSAAAPDSSDLLASSLSSFRKRLVSLRSALRELPHFSMATVLLIEDDAEGRRATSELFLREGWEVLEAGDGEAGVELALKQRPELVLCDLLMPKSNGFQACRRIRQKLLRTKIIIISGRDYGVDRSSAIECRRR